MGVVVLAYNSANSGTANTVTVDGNTISDSGHAGVHARSYNAAQGMFAINGNTISNSGTNTGSSTRHGIYVYTDTNSAKSDIDITNNTVTGSATYGVYAYTYNYCESTLDIDNNTVSDNGGSGIYVYDYLYSQSSGTISGNDVYDNGGHGIYVYANQNYYNYKSDYVIDDNNRVYWSAGHPNEGSYVGIYCYSRYSNLAVDVTGNEVYGGSHGIYCLGYGSNTTQYKLEALISGNNVHDNTGRGIYCYENYRGFLDAEIRGNVVLANGNDGIVCTRNKGQTNVVEPVITLNSVHENGNHGIYCQATEFTRVIFNNIYLNTNYDFYNASSFPVDGRFNFWGSGTTAEMESEEPFINIQRIYDTFDDSGVGLVNYWEWLPSSLDMTGELMSKITWPLSGDTLSEGELVIEGVAHALDGIDRVEVSVDGGSTWETASFDPAFGGKTLWSYGVEAIYAGTYTIISRVVVQLLG